MIKESDEKLCALVQRNETDYLIYKQICERALNSLVLSSQNFWKMLKLMQTSAEPRVSELSVYFYFLGQIKK